jgi:photosystem II stability/assembly factor-like uncharacterized protein
MVDRSKQAALAFSLAAALVLVLAGCGGSGGSSGSTEPATPLPDTLSVSTAAVAEAGVAQAFSSSAAATPGLRFEWAFGDGGSSSEAAPSYAYPRAGDYAVSLRLSNSAGESRAATTRVSVNRIAPLQGLECSGTQQGGWCWVSPVRSSQAIWNIAFADENTGWAVGAFGNVLHTRDGGRTWSPQRSGVAAGLQYVRARNANEVYALGQAGVLVRSLDGGNSWDARPVATGSGLIGGLRRFETFGTSGLFITYSSGSTPTSSRRTTQFSNDQGNSWAAYDLEQAQSSPGGVIWAFSRLPPQTGGAGGAPLWKSIDGGQNFSLALTWAEQPPLMRQRAASALVVFDDNSVLAEWQPGSDPDPGLTGAIRSLSRDGGRTWAHFAAEGFLLGHDVGGWVARALDWTAGLCGLSSDYGRTWAPMVVPGGGCAYLRDGALLGTRSISIDRGATWATYSPPRANEELGTIRRIGPRTLVQNTSISRNLGADWTQLPLPLAAAPKASGFAAVTPSRLVRAADGVEWSSDGGRTWTPAAGDAAIAYGGTPRFLFANAQTGVMVREYSDILYLNGSPPAEVPPLRTSDGGQTWAALPTAIGAADFLSPTEGFAIVGGDLKRTVDAGVSWVTPAAAGAPAPAADQACSAARLSSPQFGQGRRIAFMRFVDARRGVLIGSNGNVWVTTDGGVTCVAQPELGTPLSLTKGSDGTLWLLIEGGSLFRSETVGASWQFAGPPFGSPAAGSSWTAVTFEDANHGWLAGPQGQIAFTQDRGRSWTRQRSSLWGSVRQIQFIDSRTGWMLGDDGVIIATGTGGR